MLEECGQQNATGQIMHRNTPVFIECGLCCLSCVNVFTSDTLVPFWIGHSYMDIRKSVLSHATKHKALADQTVPERFQRDSREIPERFQRIAQTMKAQAVIYQETILLTCL